MILWLACVFGAGPGFGSELVAAAADGEVARVEALLESGTSVDERGPRGVTALIAASANGHADVAELLLQHQPTLAATASDGGTALMRAALSGYPEIVRLLLLAGAKDDRRSREGFNAVELARSADRVQSVLYLTDPNAVRRRPNARYRFGARAYAAGSEYSLRPPTVKRQTNAQHTEDTQRRGVDGVVLLDIIVTEDGWVDQTRVKRAVDLALDYQAIKCVRQWRFEAGRLGTVPVSIIVEVKIDFGTGAGRR